MDEYRINFDKLKEFTTEIFEKTGCSRKDAEAVAELLVDSDLRGVRSHGVIRIKQYVEKIAGGGANPAAEMEIISETSNTAVLDAKGGIGAVASLKAVEIAKEKAEKNNIGMVAVRNSNHFGMAGHWAIMLSGENMIGFACSNTSCSMPAPGAAEPALGNNPFAVAYSGEKYKEVCVDMACSVAAHGKAVDLKSRGKEIPMDWFLDKDGNYTNDLDVVDMLIPFAGHKGFGIAFLVETFGEFLSGGAHSYDMNQQLDPNASEDASQFFGAIKIEAFQNLKKFREDVDAFIDFEKGLKKKDGVEAIKYYGENEYDNKMRIRKEGVTLPISLINEIREVALKLGISPDRMKFFTEEPVCKGV